MCEFIIKIWPDPCSLLMLKQIAVALMRASRVKSAFSQQGGTSRQIQSSDDTLNIQADLMTG